MRDEVETMKGVFGMEWFFNSAHVGSRMEADENFLTCIYNEMELLKQQYS